jgi:ABC-type dipeptide/oligopeptide/nickel transport system ATPase component
VLFKGRDLTTLPDHEMRALRGGEIAMIFQNPIGALDPVFTVGDQIAEVFDAHPQLRVGDVRTAAADVLQRVRIPNPRAQLGAYPHQFSGGMAQRVMIGMGVAGRPSLLVADEPTTALDVSVQAQILELLRAIRSELRTAIILITHDLAITAQLCDRIVVMYAGQVVEVNTTRGIFPRAPTSVHARAARLHAAAWTQARAPRANPGTTARSGRAADRLPLRAPLSACRRALPRRGAMLSRHREGSAVRCHFPLEAP